MDFKNIIANLTDSKEKKLITTIVGVLVVIIICGLLFYFNGIGAANKHSHEEVIIDIPNGTGGSQIIEILDENGFIKNKFCAKVHVRLGGYDSLQANSYVFTRNMSLPKIMKAINTGDFNYLSKNAITIIEGSTIPMAAEAIAEKMPFSAF